MVVVVLSCMCANLSFCVVFFRLASSCCLCFWLCVVGMVYMRLIFAMPLLSECSLLFVIGLLLVYMMM